MQRIYFRGYEWIWNGRVVYCVEVESEMKYNGEDYLNYGYIAHTFQEARVIVDAHPSPMVEYNKIAKIPAWRK
jgi:hypothetical protein